MSQQHLPQSVDAQRPVTKRQQGFVDHILSTGCSVAECAEHFSTQATNVYRDLRKPHVKNYLRERTLEHIGILAPFAARTQQELLTSPSDHVKASVAENILDRHLGKPVTRQHVHHQGNIKVSIDLS